MTASRFSFVAALGLAAAVTPLAFAFGNDPADHGVGREHERITRAAIGDVDAATLDQLAGRGDAPGAVGMPDEEDKGAATHCEGGDFLAGSYPQSEAEAEKALTACRTLIVTELEAAVGFAKPLAAATAGDISLNCDFDGGFKSAKCEVLRHLGRAFHAAQDFYAHTNWVDKPAAGPVSVNNPPGLGKTGRSLWLDPRADIPFPKGLISGCSSSGELPVNTCTFGSWVSWVPMLDTARITRGALGKDLGPIGRGGSAGLGMTPRGAVNNNFKNAVAAAIEDTRDKWAYFKERVRATYGAQGEAILCALSKDALDQTGCAQTATRLGVCATRRAFYVEDNATTIVSEPTDAERKDADALADKLKGSCQIEEAGLTRDAVIGGSKAADGLALAKARAVEALSMWNACPADARDYLNLVQDEHKEALLQKEGEATKKKSPEQRREALGSVYADCILDARLKELGK